MFEESSSIFTKWMTSILQFIKEFEIEDVKYSKKFINIYLFLGRRTFMEKNLPPEKRRSFLQPKWMLLGEIKSHGKSKKNRNR